MSIGLAREGATGQTSSDLAHKEINGQKTEESKPSNSTYAQDSERETTMTSSTRDRLATLSASFWGTGWACGLVVGCSLVFVINSLLTTPGSGLSNLVAIFNGTSSVLLSQEVASWGVSGLLLHYLLFLWSFQVSLWVIENVRAVLGIRGTWTFKETSEKVAKGEADVTFCSRAHAMFYDTTEDAYEHFKTAFFLCSGLAVMRLIMGATGFLLGCINCGMSGLKPFGPITVLNDVWYYCFASLCQLSCASIMYWLGYYHWGFEGEFDTTAKILVCNHPAVLEAVMCFEISGLTSFVSKIENDDLPLFPLVTKACQAIMTSRGSKDSRQAAIDQINDRARSTDKNVKQLLIFAEGTTANNRCLIKFKKGAFIPGAAVQPICFRFPYTYFNPCACQCTNRPDSLGKAMLRTACQFVNRVEIKVLPKYEPNALEQKDPAAFGENVRQLMSQHIDLPCADVSFEDYIEEERKYKESLKERKKDK